MNNLVIGIVGKIQSGKSTLAKKLSENLDVPIISFGGYLREFSENNSLPVDRFSLQELGEKRIKEEADVFLEDVLANSKNDTSTIIIEGIRHFAIYEALRKKYQLSFFVYCETPFEERHARYIRKSGLEKITLDEFFKIDNHNVELEIEGLKHQCNKTRVPDESTEIIEAEIKNLIL